MTDKSSDEVYWLVGSEENKPYETSTWYRSVGIQEFVEKVEKKHKIVGMVFSGNNIGFIVDQKAKK